MAKAIVGALTLWAVLALCANQTSFADDEALACVTAPNRACVLEHVLAESSTLKTAALRAGMIAAVSAAQARAGLSVDASVNLARAVQEAKTLDAPDRDGVRAAIAVAQAYGGDFAAAQTSTALIDAVGPRIYALGGTAAALLGAGRAEEAEVAFEQSIAAARTASGNELVQALSSIAQARAVAGLPAAAIFDEAVGAAKAQQPDNNSIYVVARRAEAGEFQEAARDAQTLEGSNRAFVLEAIAKAEAKAGDLDDASAVAQSIPTEAARIDAWTAVAIAAAKAGKTGQSVALLRQAQDLANSDVLHLIRPEMLAKIAGGEARAGLETQAGAHIATAQQAVSGISDDLSRDDLLGAIAVAMARAGRGQDARETAKTISDNYSRALALVAVAQEEEDAKDFSDALRALQSITIDYLRANQLMSLATKLPN